MGSASELVPVTEAGGRACYLGRESVVSDEYLGLALQRQLGDHLSALERNPGCGRC